MRFSRTGLFSNTRFRKSAEVVRAACLVLGRPTIRGRATLQALQDCGVALPGIAVALATPIEPLLQHPYGFVEALLQAGGVPVDSVVVVIPTEFGVEPLEQYWSPEVTVLLTPRGAALERGRVFLRAVRRLR